MSKKKKKEEIPSEEGLKAQVAVLSEEIFLLRNELSLNRKLEKPHLLQAKKRERARALTRLTQLAKRGA